MLHVPLALRNSQNELKAAIHKHQFLLTKLKECPSDEDLQRQLDMIQKHIMSLGLVQKKLVQKLRKDLENKKTSSPEKRKQLKPSSNVKKQLKVNGNESSKPSSEKMALSATSALSLVTEQAFSDAESAATGETPMVCASPAVTPSTPAKTTTAAATLAFSAKRSPSLSPPSYCAITDRVNKNRLIQSQGKTHKGSSSPSGSEASHDSSSDIKPFDAALNNKLEFMTALGLVTRKVLCELQNRRVERKRRSTANPQFVYGNCMEQAVKRKKLGTNGIHNGEVPGVVAIDRLVPVPNSTCLVCSSTRAYVGRVVERSTGVAFQMHQYLRLQRASYIALHAAVLQYIPFLKRSAKKLVRYHCETCTPGLISCCTNGYENRRSDILGLKGYASVETEVEESVLQPLLKMMDFLDHLLNENFLLSTDLTSLAPSIVS